VSENLAAIQGFTAGHLQVRVRSPSGSGNFPPDEGQLAPATSTEVRKSADRQVRRATRRHEHFRSTGAPHRNTGVIFTGGSKIAEHGGMNEDDLHVALLVSNPNFSPRTLGTPVLTKQIAPSILQALGLDPHALEAVQMEKTPVLPGLFKELSLHLRLLLTR